ncbi:hypothetical protein BGZ73_001263, partial [Actinomortierella ambigua]
MLGFRKAAVEHYRISDSKLDLHRHYRCCTVHFKRNITKKSNKVSAEKEGRMEFKRLAKSLLDITDKSEFNKVVREIRRKYPSAKAFLDWYVKPVGPLKEPRGAYLFPALRGGTVDVTHIPDNTNAQENLGKHFRAAMEKDVLPLTMAIDQTVKYIAQLKSEVQSEMTGVHHRYGRKLKVKKHAYRNDGKPHSSDEGEDTDGGGYTTDSDEDDTPSSFQDEPEFLEADDSSELPPPSDADNQDAPKKRASEGQVVLDLSANPNVAKRRKTQSTAEDAAAVSAESTAPCSGATAKFDCVEIFQTRSTVADLSVPESSRSSSAESDPATEAVSEDETQSESGTLPNIPSVVQDGESNHSLPTLVHDEPNDLSASIEVLSAPTGTAGVSAEGEQERATRSVGEELQPSVLSLPHVEQDIGQFCVPNGFKYTITTTDVAELGDACRLRAGSNVQCALTCSLDTTLTIWWLLYRHERLSIPVPQTTLQDEMLTIMAILDRGVMNNSTASSSHEGRRTTRRRTIRDLAASTKLNPSSETLYHAEARWRWITRIMKMPIKNNKINLYGSIENVFFDPLESMFSFRYSYQATCNNDYCKARHKKSKVI